MAKLTKILRAPPPPEDPNPIPPTIYEPPPFDPVQSGWNIYTPTTYTDLQNLCDGTTPITRPAAIRLDNITFDISPKLRVTEAVNGPDGQWLYIMSDNERSMSPPNVRYGSGDLPGNTLGNNLATENSEAPLLIQDTLASGDGSGCILVGPRVKQVRFIGLHITSDGSRQVSYALTQIGRNLDGSQIDNPADLPSEIVFDRCHLHGPDGSTNSALWDTAQADIIQIHADKVAIQECHIWGARFVAASVGVGGEAHGILIPFFGSQITIRNNTIRGKGIGILFGGNGYTSVGSEIEDVYLGMNLFEKDDVFNHSHPNFNGVNYGGQEKAHFEFKHANRALIQDNVGLDMSKRSAAQGFAIAIKSANQENNTPWIVTKDLEVSWNDFRGSIDGLYVVAEDADHVTAETRRILIHNNLIVAHDPWNWLDQEGATIGSFNIYPNGRVGHGQHWQIKNNTIVSRFRDTPSARYFSFFGREIDNQFVNFVVHRNIAPHGDIGPVTFWGLFRNGGASGQNALELSANGFTWDNLAYGTEAVGSVTLPDNTTRVTDPSDIFPNQPPGVENFQADGDWSVSPAYATYGADYAALIARPGIITANTGER